MNANLFILISFCIFIFIFIKKFWPSIADQLDQHIANIKNEFSKKDASFLEHEKLKALYQERLQNLHKEIEEQKITTEQKLNFLKIKLDTELGAQYTYRQQSFQQIVHRMQQQQRKILQKKCAEEILKRVEEALEKNPSFSDEYMLSLLQTVK